MFGCFYTTSLGLTDVYALSAWLHAIWHNVDSTCSCITFLCLGVLFTEVDYAYFPCCSSPVVYDPPNSTDYEVLFNVFNHWLKMSLIPLCVSLGSFLLGIHFEVESLFTWVHLAEQRWWRGQCFSDNKGHTWHKHTVTLQAICCTLERVCVSLRLFAHRLDFPKIKNKKGVLRIRVRMLN